VFLNEVEKAMLRGDRGEGVRLAMRVLFEMGRLYGARRMIPISQAHIDGCLYSAVGEAGLEFAERLVSLGARVSVPTTLNITARDIEQWRELRIPEEHSEKSRRVEEAYIKMGCIPTWTCAPYQYGIVPRFGENIAWAESNAINFANSVLGARTNRYGDLVDICCAITGRVPEFGLHLKENRAGQVLIKFEGVSAELFEDDSMYSAAGYLVGEIAGNRIPVIEGFPAGVTHDNLKAFSAAAASSGAVGLFHVVGVTPEAPTREEAMQGRVPEEVAVVDESRLRDAARRLNARVSEVGRGGADKVDLVLVGCPHASYMEVETIVRVMDGKRVRRGVEFWITTNRTVARLLSRSGLEAELKKIGIRLVCDTCVLHFPLDAWGIRTIVTNSGKMAHYAPGLAWLNTYLRGVQGCVDAAVSGEVPCND